MKEKVELLERELKKEGFSNLVNPLYNLSDERVKSVYQNLQKYVKPKAILRDINSWYEIRNCVEAHIQKYGDKALIIIDGAAPHIWGAIPYLEKKVGARYISATAYKLSIDLLIGEDYTKNDRETKERKALDEIQIQMERDLGVVRNLGYNTIEDYIADRNNIQNPRNIIFGAEELAPHIIYCGRRKDELYTILLDFLKNIDVTSILYIEEDLHVNNIRMDFENNRLGDIPQDKIFKHAKYQGIPIEFGAFGHKTRYSLNSINQLKSNILFTSKF